jgi:hypothetical protein
METPMRDTYNSGAQADVDRAQQKRLLAALNASNSALRRDECGAWCIFGQRGAIHTFGDGKSWVVYVICRSVRHWTAAKARLSFCNLMQDGDDEGCLRLVNLPTPDQAIIIRDVIGLRKRTELAPAELERRRALGKLLAQVPGSPISITPLPNPVQPSEPVLERELAKSATDTDGTRQGQSGFPI